jgi:acyl-CoA reductase-like NAD-dependent aldehyde dehydrogenase
VLADVPASAAIASEEAFGPVATLATFDTLGEAIELANASRYGLQAGVFTHDIGTMHRLAAEIDVGALWVNDSSRYRQDNYPFGGFKLSGLGREGVRYAMAEMSELRFVGVRLGPSGGVLG